MQVIIVARRIAALRRAQPAPDRVDCRIYESVPQLEPWGSASICSPTRSASSPRWGWARSSPNAGILTAELAFYNRHGQ